MTVSSCTRFISQNYSKVPRAKIQFSFPPTTVMRREGVGQAEEGQGSVGGEETGQTQVSPLQTRTRQDALQRAHRRSSLEIDCSGPNLNKTFF